MSISTSKALGTVTSIPQALLSIRNLEVGYRTRSGIVPAVNGVDLDVKAGEVVAVVGESGSGKSTVAQSIIRLLSSNAQFIGGEILFEGRDLRKAGNRELRSIRGARIGSVPQDPGVALNPVKRVGEQVAETLRVHHRADRRGAAQRAVEMLAEVGIDDPERRFAQYPHELSGGMRQRVLIAIAMSCEPALLIADEPTSALDVTVQRRVLDQLAGLTRRHGTAVLMITHDLGVAAERADRILVMQHGRVVEQGKPESVLGDAQHPYTQQLVAAVPDINSNTRTSSRGPRKADARTPPLLQVHNLHKNYAGANSAKMAAVKDVSFILEVGRTMAIVGESGSGKTTTARMIGRFISPDSGRIFVDGQDITESTGAELRQVRRNVQFVHQNPYSALDPRHTVGKSIAEPLVIFGVGDKKERQLRVAELLDQVQLPTSYVTRLPHELSGGQRQRVAIARAIALNPKLILLDEPVSALDVSIQREVLQLLTDLQDEHQLSYLFISHDLAVVAQISDDVVVMRNGVVVESGPTAKVLADPVHEYTVELLDSIPLSRQRLTSPHLLSTEEVLL